jgi:hypothetical protein
MASPGRLPTASSYSAAIHHESFCLTRVFLEAERFRNEFPLLQYVTVLTEMAIGGNNDYDSRDAWPKDQHNVSWQGPKR